MATRFYAFAGLGIIFSLTTDPFLLIKSMQKDAKKHISLYKKRIYQCAARVSGKRHKIEPVFIKTHLFDAGKLYTLVRNVKHSHVFKGVL
jgi:hypothetical protein